MLEDEMPSPEQAEEKPDDMQEYLAGLRRRSREVKDACRDQIEHADLSLELARLAEKQLRYEDCDFVIGIRGRTAEKLRRIREKIDGEVSVPQVLDAALTHLEWKVDRESEGLRIQAGEPIESEDSDGGWDPDDEDEPWQP